MPDDHHVSDGAGIPADPAVRLLVRRLPEFVPRYLGLAAMVDDEPGSLETFAELASATAAWLAGDDAGGPVRRVCQVLEEVAADPEAAVELVGLGFLDTLDPSEQEELRPLLGPRTRTILDQLRATGI
jgi:hypothetical protein